MMMNPADHSYLVSRLQVKPERLPECQPLYAQYKRAWELAGKSGPLPHDWMIHIACMSLVLDVPEVLPAPIVKRMTRADVLAKAAAPTAQKAGWGGVAKGRLLNYASEVGMIPARFIKLNKEQSKAQIRTKPGDKEVNIWVEVGKIELADNSPLVFNEPDRAAGLDSLRQAEKVGFELMKK